MKKKISKNYIKRNTTLFDNIALLKGVKFDGNLEDSNDFIKITFNEEPIREYSLRLSGKDKIEFELEFFGKEKINDKFEYVLHYDEENRKFILSEENDFPDVVLIKDFVYWDNGRYYFINQKNEDISTHNNIDKLKLVTSLLSDKNEIVTKEMIAEFFEPFFPNRWTDSKDGQRALMAMLENHKLLFSLSAGKYKLNQTYNNERIEKYKLLAETIFHELQKYFADPTNVLLDMYLIAEKLQFDKLTSDLKIFNEHELLYVARKYFPNFTKSFWSFRSPIIFREIELKNIKGKDTNALFFRHLKNYIIKNNIDGEWINAKDFFFDMQRACGFKEHYLIQKEPLMKENGITFKRDDGNRYKESNINFKINY